MKMSTFASLNYDQPDFTESVKQALVNLGTLPQIAVIYPSIGVDISRVVREIQSIVSVPVVGATTGGAGFTEKAVIFEGVVGAFLGGDDTKIQSAFIPHIRENPSATVNEALRSMPPTGLKGHTLFLLAGALSYDGEKLIDMMISHLPLHWRIFGGLAGDGWKFTGTHVIYNDTLVSDGAVFVLIDDDAIPGFGVRHGFCPVDENDEMKVTSVEGNILHTINKLPALNVYRDALSKQGLLQSGEDIITYLARYPIGMQISFGEKWKIRTPLALQENSLVLAGSIPPHSKIKFMFGDGDSLMISAKESVAIATRALGGRKPSAQLVIDCAGRLQMLKGRYQEQINLFKSGADTPMLGFTSYGEFARYGGSLEGFHNTTAVIALW